MPFDRLGPLRYSTQNFVHMLLLFCPRRCFGFIVTTGLVVAFAQALDALAAAHPWQLLRLDDLHCHHDVGHVHCVEIFIVIFLIVVGFVAVVINSKRASPPIVHNIV